MPAFPIIDTHLHLWDPNILEYPWLEDVPLLNKPYLLDSYNMAIAGVEVEKMVFLQGECSFDQFREEAEWVTRLALEDTRIQGIVPWAPLEKGEEVKSDLEKFSDNQLIKGIRRIIQFEPDMDFCLRPNFVKGVQLLEMFDLTFDICISHHQLKNTIKLVKLCPNVKFVLDHIGKPDIKNHLFDNWKVDITELARIDNVYCKISGLVTEADHGNWRKEDLKPYIDHILGSFGFDRILFGGDWPVVLQASDYQKWVDTLDWALSGCSEESFRKLYCDNALLFYKL